MESIIGSLVVLFVLWMALAVGCAFGAKSIMLGKGRSGAAGFWLGFCLGLTGLLIAALLSPTPEHEARKMRLQMQMMGIAPPPPGAMAPGAPAPGAPAPGAASPIPFAGAPTARSATDVPSVIIALVVCVVYTLGWVALANYAFRYAFGSTAVLSLMVFGAGAALAIAALVKKSAVLIGLASGVALGVSGLGLAALAGVVGNWETQGTLLFVLPLDIAAFVGAARVALRSAAKPPVVTWWKQITMALGGSGIILTLAATQPYGIGGLVGNAPIWGGFVIAALCLLNAGRTPLALAIGWSATTVVYFVGTEFRGLSWQASTTLQQLVMLVAGGVGGVAVWALRQAPPDTSLEVARGVVQAAPPPFAASVSAFAVAPPGFAPAASPVAVPPPPVIAQVVGPSPDATMPRPRPARVVSVRFASGEAVPLSGTLILGRAPVAPERHRGSATFVVADPSFTISSTHCLLSVQDGAVWVEDLGSTNGTEVVSALGAIELGLGQRMLLTPSDRVQLGDNWCRLE